MNNINIVAKISEQAPLMSLPKDKIHSFTQLRHKNKFFSKRLKLVKGKKVRKKKKKEKKNNKNKNKIK